MANHVEPANLEFFNSLLMELEIQMSEPAEAISPALPANLKARPSAIIEALRLKVEVFGKDDNRPLTADELDRVVLRISRVTLIALNDTLISHQAPNGAHFTVRDLVAAIEETERLTRNDTEWFGGVDVHHVFCEGLYEIDDDPETFGVLWGS